MSSSLAAPTERKVTLLYLANDILQNSRKKGPEFVNEFWTALFPLLSDKKK
jgi:regulator of Ty1 transposition protein 103